MKTNHANEYNIVKNPNYQEVDQLIIYKGDQWVELGSTKKQLQLDDQSKTWTHVWHPNHLAASQWVNWF